MHVIVNRAPPAQLLAALAQAHQQLGSLAAQHLQRAGQRQVDFLDVGNFRHRGALEFDDKMQRRAHLERFHFPAGTCLPRGKPHQHR
jgi:hypothetical protein